MAIHVHNIQFTKNDDGTYHASLDLHTPVEAKTIDTQCDVRILSQAYYTSNEGQITDELKMAFHVAGLLLKKLHPRPMPFLLFHLLEMHQNYGLMKMLIIQTINQMKNHSLNVYRPA